MIDYRKLIVEFALSCVGTQLPINDEQFIQAYNKWSNTEFSVDTSPLCSIFVTYNARMVGVPTNIIPNFADYDTAIDWFKQRDQWHNRNNYRPKAGDIAFFDQNVNKKDNHIGIVVGVDGSKAYIVDACTRGSNGAYSVLKKSYVLASKYILGYASPDYTGKNTSGVANVTQLSSLVKGSYICKFQSWLNQNYNFKLDINGQLDANTRTAAIIAWQMQMNASFITCRLETSGEFDQLSKSQCDAHPLKRGSKCTNLIYIIQGLLYAHGYDPKGFDGVFNSNCQAAIRAFQRARNIHDADIVRSMTMEQLFKR